MAAQTYTQAIEYLDDNYDRAQEKGIAGNNRYEEFLVSKGILPTEAELQNEDFAYDWFMALYYNQPQLLNEVEDDFITQVLEAAIQHSANQEDMRYMIARQLTKKTT